MSVTIKDIARIANVSHTTVSRALNNSPLINEDTKKRIKEIAEHLNYTPNYSAKSLVLHKSYNIGIFFSTLSQGTSSFFFHEVIKGINEVIDKKYNLVIRGIDDYKDYGDINKKKFDGIIVMSQSISDNPFIYNVVEKDIPLVVLNREIEDDKIINILSDDLVGAYRITEYLIKCGHEKIAAIEGESNFKSTQVRKDGLVKAFIDYGIQFNQEYFVKGNYSFESGYKAMKDLLKLKDMPTSVFCFNDDMAIGAIKAISEQGLNIPQDISVVGFDDNIISTYALPALTTIKRHIGTISSKGAEILMELINKNNVDKKTMYVETELIMRESVAKIKRNI